jgi:hypothetical protein
MKLKNCYPCAAALNLSLVALCLTKVVTKADLSAGQIFFDFDS